MKATQGLRKARNTGGGAKAGCGAEVNNAAEMARFLRMAQEAPDVRLDKIAELRAAIAAGTYRVPAELIAEKLMAELWLDAAAVSRG
jgi:flagellar biosynthesis anti-sigma factor FlgM